MKIITGGVTAAKGFEAASVEAQIKYKNRKDMGADLQRSPLCGSRNLHDQCGKGSPGKMGSGSRIPFTCSTGSYH